MPKPASRPAKGRSTHPQALPPTVAVVVSRYNESVTHRLRDGALAEFAQRYPEAAAGSVVIVDAPGAYELPALSLAAAKTGRFEGIVALGCLIKGETRHDRYIAEAVSQGLVHVTIATDIPVAFGVLTVDTPKQAQARAGGSSGNKGQEAMSALLDTIEQIRILRDLPVAPRSASVAKPDKATRKGAGR
jgi:6,7-dimethyl-8-ribityllumazine synthase